MRRLVLLLPVLAAALLALPGSALAAGRDRNHDRLPDRWERAHHLSLKAKQASRDPDHDGLTNRGEFRAHTDPHNPDSDNDGIKDGQENSGRIVSFDGTTLTLRLDKGRTISGIVDENTDISCDTQGDTSGDGTGDNSTDDPSQDDSGDTSAGDGSGDDGSVNDATAARFQRVGRGGNGGGGGGGDKALPGGIGQGAGDSVASPPDDQNGDGAPDAGNDPSGDTSGDSGDGSGDSTDAGGSSDCTAALVKGAVVSEADLHTEGGDLVFDAVELLP